MKNLDIRSAVVMNGLHLYELAEALGIADATLSRKLRYEWPDEEKKRAFDAIHTLTKKEGA